MKTRGEESKAQLRPDKKRKESGVDYLKDRIKKSLLQDINDENREEIEFLLKRL